MKCRCDESFENADASGTLELVSHKRIIESQFSEDVYETVYRCRICNTRWLVDEDGRARVLKRTPGRKRKKITVTKKKPGQKIPGKDWNYNETEYGCDGVHTFENKLVWYRFSGNPHGSQAGKDQTFASFLKSGPNVDGVPENILKDVRRFLSRYFTVKEGESSG